MTCAKNQPYYIPENQHGLKLVNSLGTGTDMEIYWYQAYPDSLSYKIAYNIYYSTEEDNVFTEGPKLISTNPNLYAKISGFDPGETYYFCVRATEYQADWYNINFLTDAVDGYSAKIYPETLLASNLSATDGYVEITDIDLFPPYGVIQVGYEYIRYDSKDVPNSLLLVSERGFLGTSITEHLVDGYDGVNQRDPIIKFFRGLEDHNTFISPEESRFNYPNFPFTLADGYRQVTEDLLTTDHVASDADAIGFAPYPTNDYFRNDLSVIFKGGCLDSYIGLTTGGCSVDGYGSNVGLPIRTNSISAINDARQELLLSYTGENVVLVKRLWTGIQCSCETNHKDSPESSCSFCFGTGFVTGYEQYYNPKSSDSKIMVRFGPYTDTLRVDDAGLESIGGMDCWTLVVPTIKNRDFIIRFNFDKTEEYRYEVTDVTRNQLFFGVAGNQHFKAVRVRKTDPIYSWHAFRDTSTMPITVSTAVGLLIGPNKIPQPHTHDIVLNENITALSQINQTTSVSLGHNHEISQGIILPSPIDGHTHQILL